MNILNMWFSPYFIRSFLSFFAGFDGVYPTPPTHLAPSSLVLLFPQSFGRDFSGEKMNSTLQLKKLKSYPHNNFHPKLDTRTLNHKSLPSIIMGQYDYFHNYLKTIIDERFIAQKQFPIGMFSLSHRRALVHSEMQPSRFLNCKLIGHRATRSIQYSCVCGVGWRF